MAHLSGDEGLLAAFAERPGHSPRDGRRGVRHAARRRSRPISAAPRRPSTSASSTACRRSASRSSSASSAARRRRYVDRYFERYPGVRRYMDETRAARATLGYVSTVFGRRLYLPEINARNAQLRQYAERSAINAPMQGTAADIIKRAMIGVDGLARRATAASARSSCRCTTSSSIEVPERERRRGRRRRHANHGVRRGAARAAARRQRPRRQLGRSALSRALELFARRPGTKPSALRKGAPAILPNAGSLNPGSPRRDWRPGCVP